MTVAAKVARAPRTQQQRRDETRRALLDAAVESLIEVGFARTTTLEVQRRADVSRGALLHHFPSKAELLVAAVDHLAEMRARELKRLASSLPEGRARTDAVIALLWQCFSGAFFQVTMELRTAARTDAELRPVLVAAERSLRERIFAQARTLFGKEVAEHRGLERALDLTLQLMVGAAMTAVLHGHDRGLDELIEDWKALFPQVLERERTDAREQRRQMATRVDRERADAREQRRQMATRWDRERADAREQRRRMATRWDRATTTKRRGKSS